MQKGQSAGKPGEFAYKFAPDMSINLLTREPRPYITHVSQMQPLRELGTVEQGWPGARNGNGNKQVSRTVMMYRSGYWYNRMDGTE